MRLILLLFLSLAASLALAERQLTTIPVHHGDPRVLESAIRPWLSPGSTVTHYHNQLILNVTGEELDKARELLRQLDRQGQQLLMSLRTDASGALQQRGVEVSGRIEAGDGTVVIGQDRQDTGSGAVVRVESHRGSSEGAGIQQVRATEGMPAYIAIGAIAPMQTVTTAPDGRRYYRQDYIEAASGFHATAWVNGDNVRVSLDQRDDQLVGQTVNTQQLQTEVNGRLGEWIPVGVINESDSARTQGIGARDQSARTSSTQLFIRIELLP